MCCLLRDKLFMALIFFSLHKEVNSHKISLQSPMYKKIVCLGYSGEILVALDRSCKIALVHFRYYYFFDIVKKNSKTKPTHRQLWMHEIWKGIAIQDDPFHVQEREL